MTYEFHQVYFDFNMWFNFKIKLQYSSIETNNHDITGLLLPMEVNINISNQGKIKNYNLGITELLLRNNWIIT